MFSAHLQNETFLTKRKTSKNKQRGARATLELQNKFHLLWNFQEENDLTSDRSINLDQNKENMYPFQALNSDCNFT